MPNARYKCDKCGQVQEVFSFSACVEATLVVCCDGSTPTSHSRVWDSPGFGRVEGAGRSPARIGKRIDADGGVT